MKYKLPFSYLDKVDPRIDEWIDTIPLEFRMNRGLMDFLKRLGSYSIQNNLFNNGVNPFYKIVESLNMDKLYYDTLKTLKDYYKIDLITYLTQDNLAELYVNYPCYNASDLERVLKSRKNITNSNTLIRILEVII